MNGTVARTLPEPTWKRLGFANTPDVSTSGIGVGVVIMDRMRPHPALQHLGHRLKYIVVNDDLTITQRDIAFERPHEEGGSYGEHGLMALLLQAHAPFELGGISYVGLAPAANYVMLDYGPWREGEGERLKHGMAWILQRRDEWNLRIVLNMGWNLLEPGGWIENTDQKAVVQGLAAAVEAGLLVVVGNGNTRLENELPPAEYFAVGCYDDHPLSGTIARSPYPDEPWGRNGDGHMRPDILGPRLYLPVPYCETLEIPGRISYSSQTSGASALLAGVCAHILSLHPNLGHEALRQTMVDCGDHLEGDENPAPAVNVAKALQVIAGGHVSARRPALPPPIRVIQPEVSVRSDDPIERGLALTILARQGRLSRNVLWQYAGDGSPLVRKVAVWALQKPDGPKEREAFWEHLESEVEGGVRGWWAYGLLQDAQKGELHLWVRWAEDINWSVRWCVCEYLKQYPEYPELEKTHDLELVHEKALPLMKWYRSHR